MVSYVAILTEKKYIVACLLVHALDARRQFELATRITEVVAKEKCPRDSYDLSDA